MNVGSHKILESTARLFEIRTKTKTLICHLILGLFEKFWSM